MLKEGSVVIEMYTDSSWANGENRKSVGGHIIYVNRNVVLFKSKQQSLVCLSSTEAEFLSLSAGVQDMLWIQNILRELKVQVLKSIIYCDNQAAIRMSLTQSSTARTKHLDIKLQFIKEVLARKTITLNYVSTEQNVGDIFTKGLPRQLFERLRETIMK